MEDDTTTNALLCSQLCDLLKRVNMFERRAGCMLVMEEMIGLLLAHCAAAPRSVLHLASRFYIYKDAAMLCELPQKYEKVLCSIWMKDIPSADITVQHDEYTLCLHPDQVCDGKPLPLLVAKNSNGPPLTVKERRQSRTHSHLLKNDPQFPGFVFDSRRVAAWLCDANLMNATDRILLPNHALFENLCSVWLGRATPSPPLATLIVDPVTLLEFLSKLAVHVDARCHFTLSGQRTLFAYLVATANDGHQTDIARLAIGTTEI